MNSILQKTRMPTLSSSVYNFKYVFRRRVQNSAVKSCTKPKETFIFLQNGFSRVSLGCTTVQSPVVTLVQKRNYPADPGSGAGKGGGAGGSVREAGGGLGKYGAANEEKFFYNKTKDEIERLKMKKEQEKREGPKKKEE